MQYEKHFIPLESDPQIFTNLMHDLGVTQSFKFVDIWSLDADELSNIRNETQHPLQALVLVIPDCPAYTEQKSPETVCNDDLIWLKQTINNACGLYAILHSICNALSPSDIGR
jgi:ubiquitin carboxyl-terminal hydrolase L3